MRRLTPYLARAEAIDRLPKIRLEHPRAIVEVAGHRAIGEAMKFADHSTVELERLQSERALEKKRATASPRP